MTDIAIKVEGLGKRYKIGKLQRRHDTLRDRIADNRLFNLFKRRNGNDYNGDSSTQHSALSTQHSESTQDSEILWALRDVSFEVKRGDVVGIIGRNGAGKSTLLKILSRITEPTEGYADINGRVASLLEVGTGFNSELTGRENIYLNGSILGMKRADIVKKFDEIVAFAEVEKFIDTPVKRYSSGMYLRLAFAVAAHLEPEILIVDEVLAVGDFEFQKKCLGKMGDVADEGRTVLFVTHNLAAIRKLCSIGVYLVDGRIRHRGQIAETINCYVNDVKQRSSALVHSQIEAEAQFFDPAGNPTTVWEFGTNLFIRVVVAFAEAVAAPAVDLAFYSPNGTRVFSVLSDRLCQDSPKPTKRAVFEFSIDNTGLACEEVSVDLGVRANRDPRYMHWWQTIASLAVTTSRSPVTYWGPDTICCLPCSVAVHWDAS